MHLLTREDRKCFASVRCASHKSFTPIIRASSSLRVSFTCKPHFNLPFIPAKVFWLSVGVKCYLICGRREKEPRSSVISEPPLPQYIYLDSSMRLQPRKKAATLQCVHEMNATASCVSHADCKEQFFTEI